MGILFACKCELAGHETTLIDHCKDRAKRLAKNGLSMLSNDKTITANPAVSTIIPKKQDCIIVLSKSYSTATLTLPNTTPILTLQNGLGNVETLCKIAGSSKVIAGSTYEASTLLEEGKIHHTATGDTTIGAWTSCSTESTEKALREAGFEIRTTNSPGQLIWDKAIINAGINPLSALLNVQNGELIKKQEVRQLMRDLVVEAARAASTEGYRFDYSLVEKTEEICMKTAANVSSMLQDVRAKRKTEIDSISGEILNRSDAASLKAPRTRVIYQLIKGLEPSP